MMNGNMIRDLSGFRMSYENSELLEDEMHSNPLDQFLEFINLALHQGLYEPYAMSLSTVDSQGRPHGRILLIRGATERGFEFFTHYNGNKGRDLEHQPYAEMLFFWGGLQTQVRVSGKVHKMSEEESIEYFHKRPRGSQIATHVSEPQSGVIANREALEQRYAELEAQFADTDVIPKPETWGGFILVPERYEFWQGRKNRLHDRIVYELNDGQWVMSRLMP